jgi:hypothetical protein
MTFFKAFSGKPSGFYLLFLLLEGFSAAAILGETLFCFARTGQSVASRGFIWIDWVAVHRFGYG